MYGHPELAKAMNNALRPEGVALCFELPKDGSIPEWLELVPAGDIKGRDERRWINDEPEAVVAAFNSSGKPIPVDYEHAVEKTPPGTPVLKAAWIEAMEVRDGSVWGKFEWTERGLNSIEKKDYRFISPVFLFRKDNNRVMRLTSVALTDDPNLHLKAINNRIPEEESPMTLSPAIRQALSLDENATEDHAVAAINKLNGDLISAQNRANQSPSLDKYVPRPELETALERAQNAEQKLKTLEDEQRDNEIEATLDKFSKHYAPAKREHYKAMCKQEGGVELFEKIMEGTPEIAADTHLDGKTPEDEGTALNAEEQRVAEMFGNSLEDIKKYGQNAA